MLADAYGVDQGTVYDMISKGKIAGTDAVEIILEALGEAFQGAMKEQSETFSGKTSTLQGLEQEMENAMGAAYNEGALTGIQGDIDAYTRSPAVGILAFAWDWRLFRAAFNTSI